MNANPLSPLPIMSLPAPDDPVSSAEYWGWLRRHELRIQRCTNCSTTRNPPSEVCSQCYSTEVEWTEIPTTGTIFSWTRIWHPAAPMWAEHVPYLVAWIEIDHPDSPRVMGNLLGDPLQDVAIGQAVDGVFEDRPEGTILNWHIRAD